MFKFTYFLLTLPILSLLAPILLGSPVPDQDRVAAAEFTRRLQEAGIDTPSPDANGNSPTMQLTPLQMVVARRIIQEIQGRQDAPPVQAEGQMGDILDEIREATVITESMQARFWDYVRQDELTPNDSRAIQVLVEALSQPKLEKLISDYVLGNEISFDLEEVNGRGVATTALNHSISPRLFRLGHTDLAMRLLTPIGDMAKEAAEQMLDITVSQINYTPESLNNVLLKNNWIMLAWRAQLNGSMKVMAIKGDTTSLERLFNMRWTGSLTPMDRFTAVMWAFWFNQPATAQFLMGQVGETSQLVPGLQDLHRILGYWCSLSARSSRDNIRNNIKGQRMSNFNSGYFFNEYPQAGRLLDRPIEDSQDAVLDAMENQLIFSFLEQ
ncbi:hypothetical protein H4R33_006335 [Dimargaris cristalligena]|nr:hypothetical protein H4R33_006335 [Dimargaris cristalligena]